MSGPYDSQYAYNQGYDNQYQYQYQPQSQYQSTYPTSGFSQSQGYADTRSSYPQDYNYNNSYYSQSSPPAPSVNVQGPDSYYNSSGPQHPGAETTDRGLLGAVAGGTAGAFAGHKTRGHGVLGAIGGAILGSLTEDYAKKGKKQKHGKKDHRSNSSTSSMSSNSAMSGLGPMASGFFSQGSSKK